MDQPVQNNTNFPNPKSSGDREGSFSPPTSNSPYLQSQTPQTPPAQTSPANQPAVRSSSTQTSQPQATSQPVTNPPMATIPTASGPSGKPPTKPPQEEAKLEKGKKTKKINFLLPLVLLLTLTIGGGGAFYAYQKMSKKETTESFYAYPDWIKVECVSGESRRSSGLMIKAGSESYTVNQDGTGTYQITYTFHNIIKEPLEIRYNWLSCWCPEAYPPSDGSQGACLQNCLLFNETPVTVSNWDQIASLSTRTMTLPGQNEDAPGQNTFELVISRTEEDCGSLQTDLGILAVNNDTSCSFIPGHASVYFTERECPTPAPLVSPSPSPLVSPSPSPGVSPSPSPSPFIECTTLGPQPSNPQPGDELTFTCSASATGGTTINHYNFRVNQGTVTRVDSSNTQASFNYTVPAEGESFTVQCQVCSSSDNSNCTTWGQAN